MPVNYDRAVSRAPVFDRAPNRDFETVRWYVSRPSQTKARGYRSSNGNFNFKYSLTMIVFPYAFPFVQNNL